MQKDEYIFQRKYGAAILSNSTQKLLWFEITKMLIAVKKLIYCVIYYNFLRTFVPYWDDKNPVDFVGFPRGQKLTLQ